MDKKKYALEKAPTLINFENEIKEILIENGYYDIKIENKLVGTKALQDCLQFHIDNEFYINCKKKDDALYEKNYINELYEILNPFFSKNNIECWGCWHLGEMSKYILFCINNIGGIKNE